MGATSQREDTESETIEDYADCLFCLMMALLSLLHAGFYEWVGICGDEETRRLCGGTPVSSIGERGKEGGGTGGKGETAVARATAGQREEYGTGDEEPAVVARVAGDRRSEEAGPNRAPQATAHQQLHSADGYCGEHGEVQEGCHSIIHQRRS